MLYTTLSHLTDKELLLHVMNERDPLTTTPLETELAERFERIVHNHKTSALIETLENFGLADDPERLLKRLELADSFLDIAADSDDIIQRLNNLFLQVTK